MREIELGGEEMKGRGHGHLAWFKDGVEVTFWYLTPNYTGRGQSWA